MGYDFDGEEADAVTGLQVRLKGKKGSFPIDVQFAMSVGVAALFGPSGAGKSTILRGIAGLWTPEHGSVRLGNEIFFDRQLNINLKPELRGLGIVFQDPLLFPHMTVKDNLSYGMIKDANWNDIIALLDLNPLLNRMPKNLSGGEAQRVSIGRALLSHPRLLLLDEPLTGLDEARREQVLPYLERLHDETGVPILYVSHNKEEIVRLADQVFVIENGSVDGTIAPNEF